MAGFSILFAKVSVASGGECGLTELSALGILADFEEVYPAMARGVVAGSILEENR